MKPISAIDTVKQAEMFASVRAAYNIPRDENMKLRDFPTLAHVIKFAQDRAAGVVTQKSVTMAPAITNEPAATPVSTPAITAAPAPATTVAASTPATVAAAPAFDR